MITISTPRLRFLGEGEEGNERNGSWRWLAALSPQTPPQLPVSDPVIRFALLLILLTGKRAISPLVSPFPINLPTPPIFLNRKKNARATRYTPLPPPKKWNGILRERTKERKFRNVRTIYQSSMDELHDVIDAISFFDQ